MDGVMPKPARGRPKVNTSSPMNLRPMLAILRAEKSIKNIDDAVLRIRERHRLDHRGNLAAETIKDMLLGKSGMNPAVLQSLHSAFGYDKSGYPFSIWNNQEAFLQRREAGPQMLLRILRSWKSPKGRHAILDHDGRRTARVTANVGPPCLQSGTHLFNLQVAGMREAHAMLIEFGELDRLWWSLVGFRAVTIDGKPIDPDTKLRPQEATRIQMTIGNQPGRYEIFALVSGDQFDAEIFNFVPVNGDNGDAEPVKAGDLAAYLSSLPDSAKAQLLVGSFAYQGMSAG